jgi:hypothetical protein
MTDTAELQKLSDKDLLIEYEAAAWRNGEWANEDSEKSVEIVRNEVLRRIRAPHEALRAIAAFPAMEPMVALLESKGIKSHHEEPRYLTMARTAATAMPDRAAAWQY